MWNTNGFIVKLDYDYKSFRQSKASLTEGQGLQLTVQNATGSEII